MREYLVIDTSRYFVKHFSRRTADEIWSVRPLALLTDIVNLESCACTLTLAEIYAGVDLTGKTYLPEYIEL